MKRLFSLTRALVARKRKIFALFFALAASIGMMNAKVTWNRCNISDLDVHGTFKSYSKEGVTLSANAEMIDAQWYSYGDESYTGIEFHANETGGFTFSNSLGKNFTKIEMTLRGPARWDNANLGSGWSFSWEDYGEEPAFFVTWTGNASTVDLLKDESVFHGGEYVKRIVFYFEGDSEEPDPTYTVALKDGTANADKVTLSATSVEECTTVTVTPNEECDITAFKATYNTTEELSTSFNTETGAYSFTMPAYDVTIEATIALKPAPEGDVFAGFTATAGSGGFTNEGHANLVDNKFTSADWTKWCADNSYKSVPTGESGDACWWIDFEASAALNLTGYILTTGNDSGNEHGRNPKNWVLKAKLNAGDAWTTIATVTNDVTMKNQSFKDYKFYVDQSGSYKYFRFEVFANQGANVMQLCQLRLIGTEASAPANSCGDGLTWELNNGELVISYDGEGTGVMNDYDIPNDNPAPWYANRENITSVSLPEGIKTIGKDAFRDCVNLTTVTIPNSVTTIGESAFVTVEHLETVTIGTGITSIVNGAFYGNAELTTVTCSATTPPSIGGIVFGSCTNLTQIYVPAESVDAYKSAWSDYASLIKAIGGGDAPDGALSGAFTINANGDKIVFSKGNLQATTTDLGTNWTWDFAPNQWSLIGNAVANNAIKGNKKVTANGTVDLFGWSTAATYYGINESWKNDDYAGDFVDWGALMGTEWRTLSRAEWLYIVYDRTDAYKKRGQATVNGVPGYVLLPDAWTLPSGLSFTYSVDNYTTNQYDGADWTAMESAGAVFLPAAGVREGTDIYQVNLYGWYWASTPNETDGGKAYYLYFDKSSEGVTEYNRWKSKSVRLVTEAPIPPYEAAIKLISAIGEVAYTAECKAKIDAARAAYDALNDGDKAQVTNLTTLTDAETTYAGLLAQAVKAVKDQIDALPATPLTDATKKLSEYNKVTAAREAYNALSDEEKAAVSNYDKLEAAEAAFAAIGGGDAGALKGKFSVADGKVVYFSKGNLQATTTDLGANWTWAFAANQYDCVADNAANTAISGDGTVSTNGTVDLFGWSTAATQYGIHVKPYNSTYSGDFVDWGSNPALTAALGEDWRTLTSDEWTYLLDTRTTTSGVRYAKAEITDKTYPGTTTTIKGLIILPDDWSTDYHALASTNTADAAFTSNQITSTVWENELVAHGAVFMPAAGYRLATSIYSYGDRGYYWSATPNGAENAYELIFIGDNVYLADNGRRFDGHSVRLVTETAPASPLNDAQAAKDLIDAIPQPVVYTPECGAAIKAAREALDALSDEAKAFFATADTAALSAAETAYAGLLAEKVAPVIAAIDAVPATPLTDATKKLSEYNKVTDARALYDALATDEEKAAVTNYDKLTAAEAAYAAISGGTPAGALSGKFTVEDGKVVYFSKGNLQLIATNTWKFADNQWDYFGTEQSDNHRDLFGWGAINETQNTDHAAYTWNEWGENTDLVAALGTGWRTLTKDEWNELFFTRSGATVNGTADARFAKATINTDGTAVTGVILFPDDYDGSTPAGVTWGDINATDDYYSTSCTEAGWDALEALNCVFLPVLGERWGTAVSRVGERCAYWSSTASDENNAYNLRIEGTKLLLSDDFRAIGDAVRLVTETASASSPIADAQAAKALIDAIGEVSYPDSKEAIKAAREALDALSDEAKALFATADTAALPQAEATYAGLLAEKVAPVIAAIDAVPATPLTDATKKLSEYNKVTDARALYDALATDEEKAAVTNYDKLTAAEAAFAAIGGGGSAPAGALSGKFTIDESSVVYFSKGNLQATTADLGANWTWGFAANQYYTIGNVAANNAISGNGEVSENGTVDLFGWSTSATKYGIHNGNNKNISDYAGDFADWGAMMGDGWFTLSKEQWEYLLNTRTGDKAATVNSVADCRYTKATINTDGTAVKGIILFPDGGTFAASEFTEVGSPNTENANYTTTCTTAQWNALQAKGCVFLPAAGRRYGADVSNEDPNGYYWSSSPKPSTDDAYFMFFYSYGMYPATNDFRCLGLSVRLVTEAPVSPLADAQAVKDLIDAIGEVSYPDSKEAIKAAREALDALSDEAKALFATADTAALPAAEATYAGLLAEKVAPVIAAIDAIPSPIEDNLKLSVYDKVTDARALYDALTDEEKAAVTNYGKLTAAEAAFAAISGGDAVVVWSTETLGTTFEIGQKSTSEPKFGITLTTGEWRYFTTYEGNVLRFGFNTASNNNGFTFTNTSGSNLTKIVVSLNGTQDKELTYFETPGWTLNTTNRTLTWEGDASNVSIWDNLTEMVGDVNVDFVQFTIPGASSPLNDAQAALDKINAIPQPVVYTPECSAAIKAAREAVDALGENASLLDDADLQKLKDAEAAYADLLAEKVAPVIAAINSLPATPLTPENTKLSEYNKVTDARALYDALTDEEKAAVTNYDKLTAAEEAFAAINNGGGTIYDSGSVALTDLKVGDILKGGVSLTGEATDKVGLQSLAQNGEKKDGEFILSFEYMTPLLGENAAVTSGSMVFTPIAEDGNAGDAWIVFDGSALTEATVWLKGINSAALPSVLADAQAAVDLINAIPQPVVYTPECSAAIKAAREAVDALGENASLLDDADLQKLTDAEAAYAALLAEKVAPVIAAIDAIPSPIEDNLKLSVYDKVTDARALYDALSDEEKAAVSNYEKLTAAEAAFAAIDKGAGTVYDSGSVALTDLKVGDILKGGVTLIAEASDKIGTLRVAMNGEKKEGVFYILPFEHMNPLLGENAAISHGPNVFSPIAEDGNAGDAWIVTDGSNQATVWLRGISTAALPSIFADAQAAVDLINAIPDPVVLSDECKAKIDAAREAVTALGENASLIDDADIDKLAKAEADFALLIKDATAVVAKIDAIGDVTFSAECKEKIVDAREAYEALADELKPYVTNLTKLTDAEAAYEAARPFAPVTTVPAAVEALQYTGAAQTLITAGAVEHGTILYSLDGVDYSTELPTALLPGAYTVYYKVQATDDYKDVAPTTFIATIAYNYPATYGLFGIPEGWSVKVNDEEVAVVNGAVKNIAANDRFDIMPVKPEDVKLVEIVPYLLDLATATDSVIYLMNGDSITGTANGNITIVIVPDAKVYFKNVNLTNTGSHPAVLCGGNAEMVVVGENSITCTTEGEYGIRAAGAGTTLTISGKSDANTLNADIDANGGTVNQ